MSIIEKNFLIKIGIKNEEKGMPDDSESNWYDVTPHIALGSYKVNYQRVYETYTDSAYVTHQTLKRKKATGTFSVVFNSLDDYVKFANWLTTNIKSDGGYYVKLWVNNELRTVNAQTMFIGYTPTGDLPLLALGKTVAYEITVEQA